MKTAWFWFFLKKDLLSLKSRSAVRWMNLFAFVSVLLGVFAWILVMAFMEGLQNQSREQMLMENPHLLWEGAVRNDVFDKEALLKEKYAEALKKTEFVFQSEALLEKSGIDDSSQLREGVIIQGSDDVAEATASIGRELAAVSQLQEGDEFSLLSVWRLEGMPMKVKVGSVFDSGVYEIDKLLVKLNRQDLQSWLGLGDAVSRVSLQFKNPEDADVYQSELSELLGLPLKTWKQVDESYWYSLKLERFAMAISLFFVIALASLSVNMAVAARVVERSREICLLRSMGMSANKIFSIYLAQGACIGLFSSIFGAALAYPVGEWISHAFKLPSMFYINDLPVHWDARMTLLICFLSTALSIWASWKPARRAMRTPIPSGLRI